MTSKNCFSVCFPLKKSVKEIVFHYLKKVKNGVNVRRYAKIEKMNHGSSKKNYPILWMKTANILIVTASILNRMLLIICLDV